MLFIPKGLAHGFLSLEEGTILNYKCDNYYNQISETGFNLFKSKVETDFPLLPDDIYMSIKDIRAHNYHYVYLYYNII